MITLCRSCKSSLLKPVISLGDQYLSDFRDDDTKPPMYPIDVLMCKNCTLLQMAETTPPSEMYHDRYGYASGVNQTMRDHLKGIVKSVKKAIRLRKGDVVVDIGSNDGTLLSNYPTSLERVGFDPVTKFGKYYEGTGIHFINDYFNKEAYTLTKKAKVITAISMFYDLEDPNSFVRDLAQLLDKNGIIVIQQNYLAEMLRQCAIDNICHEHLEFYSLSSLLPLLARHGLRIFHVEVNDLNGGSFRTYICHDKSNHTTTESVSQIIKDEYSMGLWDENTYLGFSLYMQSVKDQLYTLINDLKDSGSSIYLYGASTRVNTLLQYCGLDKSTIAAAVERNPTKWGKKIASSGIPIISEEQARSEQPDYMLVGPWFFKDEIVKREKKYLDRGGHLIFPLPEIEII